MSSPTHKSLRSSRRAAVACSACNARKVRCTVTLSGTPCANCIVDGIPCEVLHRKRRRNADLLLSVPVEGPADGGEALGTSQVAPSRGEDRVAVLAAPPGSTRSSRRVSQNNMANNCGEDASRATQISEDRSSQADVAMSVSSRTLRQVSRQGDSQQSASHPAPGITDLDDAADDSSAYAATLEGGTSNLNGMPFYPGDRRGPAFLMDICEPQRSSASNHRIVNMPRTKSLPPEDVEYLRTKGAFTLPPTQVLEALIQCYFQHVHPFAPILDPFHFIVEYENGRASLLLLWSLFVASASFIDQELLTSDLYSSRTALKRAAYQRAKALYDANYETDKMTLIQSVFLMGHFYTNSDDRAGPWHWTGIAISLSHTVGLHRLPALASEDSRAIRPLWRRLWWSIYCREAWLSLGQGRPMRISLDDSDTALPGAHDKDVIPSDINEDLVVKYLPEELDMLFSMWISFVMLGIALGTILSTNYRAKAPKPTRADLEVSEREIRACHIDMPVGISQSRLIASHYHQFKLYFEATIIVLYRPFILESPREISPNQQESWRMFACQKTRSSATTACNTVTSMMAEDLIGLSHTLTVLAIVPPMQIHLFESTSSNPINRQMGKHHLALCMLAVGELSKSYISATAAYKLFEKAIQKVDNARGSIAQPLRGDEEAQVDASEPNPWQNWPQGYSPSTAGVITDAWLPWASDLGTHCDVWMERRYSNEPPGNGDISHMFSTEWSD